MMNQYESFALNEHLSDWPENLTYPEVLAALTEDENYDVVVAEDFEHLWKTDLADRIEHFKALLEQYFIPRP